MYRLNGLRLAKSNSYFVDALIDDVIASLSDESIMGDKVMSREDAEDAVYAGGLKIISSQDKHIQDICDEVFSNPDNYPDGTKLYPDYALTVSCLAYTISPVSDAAIAA